MKTVVCCYGKCNESAVKTQKAILQVTFFSENINIFNWIEQYNVH